VDAAEFAVVVQPTGAAISRRMGTRGGPRGRSMLPDGWDGSRSEGVWDRPPTVRLHPVGRAYSVIRTWIDAEQRFQGWYVNLEQPWARTTVGFDSCDNTLDVTVSDDLSHCALKDGDELDFAVSTGLFSQQEAASICATAAAAIDDVTSGRWPFDESAWLALRPPVVAEQLSLPAGWSDP
jgi:hypothetical protein